MNIKIKSKAKKDFLIDSSHIFILFSFAVAQPLYDLLSQYADFFIARHSKPIDIILLAFFISILIPYLFVLIEMHFELISHTIRKFLHLGLVCILTGAIVFPILKKIEFFNELLIWIITLLLGGTFIFGYIRLRQLRTYITFLLPSVLIFPIFFLFFSPISKIAFPKNLVIVQKEQKITIKKYPPIVMVVFDGLATPYLMNEDKQIDPIRYPNFASLANQAYWFRYTTTVVHSTTWSIPAMLSGLYPSLGHPKLPSVIDFPRNLFTLLGDIYILNAFESSTELCPRDLIHTNIDNKDAKERLASLFSDISIVYLHYLLPQSLSQKLPDISQDWGEFYEKQQASFQNNKKKQKTGGERTKLFKKFLDSILPRRVPTLNFLHIKLPHSPVMYLPSGKTYGKYYHYFDHARENKNENEWSVISQFQRYLLQLQYVDKLLGWLLAKLKKNKLYEDSLIVITADHGMSFRPGILRRGITKKNAGDIMPVPLFIKLPNQKEGQVNDSNVETVDIMPTIANAAGRSLPWPVDGHSVFAESFPKKYHKIIFGKKKYMFSYDNFKKMFSESLNHMFTLFGSGKTKPNGLFEIGPFKNIIGERINRFEIVKKKSIKINISEISPFIENVDVNSRFIPCFIIGHIFTNTPLNLAIAVNGTFQGVSKTVLTKKNLSIFFTMVPEHAFKAGKNTLKIFIVRKGSDGKIELEQTINK